MFLLSCLWARILVDYGALHSFIAASCVRGLGLEVETLENLLYVSSKILLTVDLRVIDMSEFDVILRMDWLTAHRVVIDYDCRRFTTYT